MAGAPHRRPDRHGQVAIGRETICRALRRARGRTQAFLVPYRSLAAEIHDAFRERLAGTDARVRIATGHHRDPLRPEEADLLVATYESFVGVMRSGELRPGSVVADEVHVIADDTRGPLVEGIFARLLASGRTQSLLALSAVVENARELAAWLGVELPAGSEADRPVALAFEHHFAADLDETLEELLRPCLNGEQALVFCRSRPAAERTAWRLRDMVAACLAPSERRALAEVAGRLGDPDDPELEPLRDLVAGGVGYHHAGLPKEVRREIETLFRAERGLIRVVTCTPTLAAGVNLPAGIAVVRDVFRSDRVRGTYRRVLLPSGEILNMLGRAARPHYVASGAGHALIERAYRDEPQVRELVEAIARRRGGKVESRLAQSFGGIVRFVLALVVERGETARDDGHYALGFLELLGADYPRAVVHLEQALAGFGQRPEVYRGGNLLMCARLHVGLALCLALPDVTQLHRARRLLREAMEGGERIPPYLVADVLDALAFADRVEAERVAEDILAASADAALDEVAASLAARRCGPAADALVRRARDGGRSLTDRPRDWHLALPMLIAQGRANEAAEALDSAEEAAMQGILRAEFLDLLRDEARYGPVWTVDDARWSHVRVLEAAGDYANASGFLRQVFQLALARGDDAAEASAREVLERLEDYPEGFQPLLAELREQFRSRFGPQPTPVAAVEPGQPIRILVVGGNETQSRFGEKLAQAVRAIRADVVLQFFHSGWTSNWGVQVEEFERRLNRTDGVVFSRYMRTGFGEQARKRLGRIPWRGCGGKGQGAFANTILALAADVDRIRAASREQGGR